MLSPEHITPYTDEQGLIRELVPLLGPLHWSKLQYHNFWHSYGEVLPAVLRLDELDPDSNPLDRRILIAASLGHEVLNHMPLFPGSGFRTKEERAIVVTRPLFESVGFKPVELGSIGARIEATNPLKKIVTIDDRKMRRGDLGNLDGPRLPCLAKTVSIFNEEIMLAEIYDEPIIDWRSFIIKQIPVLRVGVSPDLTIGREILYKGQGKYSRRANRNIDVFETERVQNPFQFVTTYGKRIAPYVPDYSEAKIIGQAAA
jgi:hypothetical protein